MPSPDSNPSPKQAAKRKATEQRILDAFERLLQRGGSESVGINAVVEEAQVGKGLIYAYFGGLEGLVQAWAAQKKFEPAPEDIIGEPIERFRQRSKPQQVAAVHRHYAGMLRDSPLAAHIMAEELFKPGQLSETLDRIRKRLGASHEKIFTELAPLEDSQQFALCMIFLAAANYLGLRAHAAPNFNGIQLNTDAGWAQAMSLFDEVAEALAPAPKDPPN